MKVRSLKLAQSLGVAAVLAVGFSSCKYETSNVTGWDLNNPENGGFQKVPFVEQETGPGLILIEGGTFTMGRVEQDVTYDWDNIPRRVTVSSFYLDEFEITNFQYLEYLYWLRRTFESYPMVYKNALPDTLVWREKMAFNEPYVEYYLRHPAYRDYPVVGVNWLQANDFCKWRTDRVNEFILIREGVLKWEPNLVDDPFTTDAYMVGQHNGEVIQALPDLNPSNPGTGGKRGRGALGDRIVRMEDGILLPRYRLPTEAEWEFASYGLIGNTTEEIISERRLYPWNGHWVRNPEDKWQGQMLGNFVRGRGDYMGVAGQLNDNADVTAPVDSYWPNDYGLYNMSGNVSEWVMDVYRPLNHEDFDEFRPFRGNVFKTKVLTAEGAYNDKHDIVNYDIYSMKEYIIDFRKVRQESGRMDVYDDSLINEIERTIDAAIGHLKLDEKQEASLLINEQIFEGYLVDFTIGYDPDRPDYSPETTPMLRDGLSEFILHGGGDVGTSTPGSIRWREVTAEENMGRRNYTISDNINYLDGDLESSHYYESNDMYGQDYQSNKEAKYDDLKSRINDDTTGIRPKRLEKNLMYQSIWDRKTSGVTGQPTTLISDKSRVYKGGSWRDRAYWMNAGTRRFLDEDKSNATIGFRCAMTRVGSPRGLNSGSSKKKKKK